MEFPFNCAKTSTVQNRVTHSVTLSAAKSLTTSSENNKLFAPQSAQSDPNRVTLLPITLNHAQKPESI